MHATRSYFGEFDSGPLLEWLNKRGRPANDPVEKLIRLNADLDGFSVGDVVKEIQTSVAAIVRRAKLGVAPIVGAVGPKSWDVDWRLVGKMYPPQALALIRLLHLAARGALDRVRHCENKKCGRWFYGRFSHQRFHSLVCQQETFRHDPDWQAKRREYMKDLRQRKKLQEQRWFKRKGRR